MHTTLKIFFVLLLSFFAANSGLAAVACAPFKVHLLVHLPTPPQISVPPKFAPDWEIRIAEKISKIKTQSEFARIYRAWLEKNPKTLSERERFEWLSCLEYYVSIDTDHDGIPDWSAIVDKQPATTLFPEDPDQDGDGISNVLDADPLTPGRNPAALENGIPAHLKFDARLRPEAARLQLQLYEKYHVLAIDHTDQHSPLVLLELLTLLERAFTPNFVSDLKIKYIYAFAGHDPSGNIASFHWQAEAISVGGIKAYPLAGLEPQQRVDLLSALSHEIGHAVLFEKLSPDELSEVSQKFSDWTPVTSTESAEALFSPVFFKPYENKSGRNIVSRYAMMNRHEWFAESFAANVITHLGETGALGKNWRTRLKRISLSGSDYWFDYNLLSGDFRAWFGKLISRVPKKRF